jgi:hypothetical protein
MRENKLEGVAPTEPRPAAPGAKPKVAKEDLPDEEIIDDGKKPQKAGAGHAAKPAH